MSRLLASVLATAVATVIAGCSTQTVRVRADHDTTRNVAAYRTFGFYDQQSTDQARYSTLLTSHLKAATRQQLEQRGYAYTESNPQLLVNFTVNVRQQQEVRASVPVGGFYGVRAAHGWGGYDIDTVTTKQGTVTIDVVEAASRSLIWQGIGEGAVSGKAERNTAAAVNTAVSGILRNFPSKSAPGVGQ